jgi:hypothetical protein
VTKVLPVGIEASFCQGVELSCVSASGHQMLIKNAPPQEIRELFALLIGVRQ